MHPARIAELLVPYLGRSDDPSPNPQDLIPSISTYIDILLRWNARINLTAIRDPEQVVTRHFGESLFAAGILFPDGRAALQGRVTDPESIRALAPEGIAQDQRPKTQDRCSLADVGSGAGFPGLPIKLWAPQIHLTLIESNHKKTAFLREVTRALTLTDVNIQNARAETLPANSFEVVTLRAVERFESILPVAATLVAPGGRLALLIAAPQLPQAQSALPDFSWSDPIPVPLSRSRIVVIADRPQ